ncbi:carbon monoxide dehydrogenase beta subunit family protein [Nitrospira sp. Kam-Ns4a]
MIADSPSRTERLIDVGPIGFHPPSAMELGVTIPDSGAGLLYGREAPEDRVIREAARQMFTRANPTMFPGPLYLWAWHPDWIAKGQALLRLAAEIPGVMIIPMPDYRPKYPKIDPEEGINPNHPNLTIWHNKIEVALFIGIHCHYANLALRMVRAGTNCLTIAFCHDIHEDAMLSVQDLDVRKLDQIIEIFRAVRTELGVPMPADGKTIRLTGAQRRANHGAERVAPVA